jgi:hypothetical protein
MISSVYLSVRRRGHHNPSAKKRATVEHHPHAARDPHQPYSDVTLTEEDMNIQDVERMEGEGMPVSFEGDLGPVTPKAHDLVTTPRTEPPEEGWEDETVEGGIEKELVSPRARDRAEEFTFTLQTVRGCNCSCPRCPEECPPTCECAGHTRHSPNPPVSGDEP